MIGDLIKHAITAPLKVVNSMFLKNYYEQGLRSIGSKIDELEGDENILIISPKALDAVIGLGGTLIKFRGTGEKSLVYLNENSCGLDSSSLEDMGIGQVYAIGDEANRTHSLTEILRKLNPDIIFAPFLLDGDIDNVESSLLTLDAIKNWDDNFENIWMYEVNTPNDLRLINRISSMDSKIYEKKENLYERCSRDLGKNENIDVDCLMLMDKKKALLVNNKAKAAEVFVKLDYRTARDAKEILAERGFSPEQIASIDNHFNVIVSSLRNKKLRDRYNNNLNYIIKNMALEERKND